MNKKTITSLMLAACFSLCAVGTVACSDVDNGGKDKTYTVTWTNDDGTVLETDKNVKAGSMPKYDGATPTKDGNEQYCYTFAGWSPEITKVTKDVTYTATFTPDTNKYTVTWKNYDGTVLKTDADIPYGITPEYNGATPQRVGTEDISYVFSGWTPSVGTVTGNATYTAKFTAKYEGEQIAGVVPVFSEDNKTVQYGFYPQTHVSDQTVIAELDKLTPPADDGWYLFDGDYYVKQTAQVCNGESGYTFDDGTKVVDGAQYWFKCEVITWRVLSSENGAYFLLSDKLLDAYAYYTDYADRTEDGSTVYANNYEQSAIRGWLNNDFYNIAFSRNDVYITETEVNNGASATETENNRYACDDTTDKVYLPSYQDYINSDYGFASTADDKSTSRACKTTDYARARGAWCNTQNDLSYNGSYWTRSPSDKYYYCAWNVNSGGYISEYAVDGNSHCVRPCISLCYPD